jgi:hypothetical protein
MVVPWCDDAESQLVRFREALAPLANRILVLVDDREPTDIERISAITAPISVLPWSRRDELALFIIKDAAD